METTTSNPATDCLCQTVTTFTLPVFVNNNYLVAIDNENGLEPTRIRKRIREATELSQSAGASYLRYSPTNIIRLHEFLKSALSNLHANGTPPTCSGNSHTTSTSSPPSSADDVEWHYSLHTLLAARSQWMNESKVLLFSVAVPVPTRHRRSRMETDVDLRQMLLAVTGGDDKSAMVTVMLEHQVWWNRFTGAVTETRPSVDGQTITGAMDDGGDSENEWAEDDVATNDLDGDNHPRHKARRYQLWAVAFIQTAADVGATAAAAAATSGRTERHTCASSLSVCTAKCRSCPCATCCETKMKGLDEHEPIPVCSQFADASAFGNPNPSDLTTMQAVERLLDSAPFRTFARAEMSLGRVSLVLRASKRVKSTAKSLS